MIKIGVVIVTYQNLGNLIKCLNSLKLTKYPYFTVLLINNNPNTKLEFLKKRFGKLNIINSKQNLGFGRGVNIGIKYFLNKNSDYILLLNDDGYLQTNFFKAMRPVMDSQPQAILGCAISYASHPEKIWYGGGDYNHFFCFTRHRFKNDLTVDFYKKERHLLQTDFISGCMMLIPQKAIRKVGFFGEKYFLNFEDVEYCLRAKKIGINSLILPKVLLTHEVSATAGTEGSELSATRGYYLGRNPFILIKEMSPKILWLSNIIGQVFIRLPYYVVRSVFNSKYLFLKSYVKGLVSGLMFFLDIKKFQKSRGDLGRSA